MIPQRNERHHGSVRVNTIAEDRTKFGVAGETLGRSKIKKKISVVSRPDCPGFVPGMRLLALQPQILTL